MWFLEMLRIFFVNAPEITMVILTGIILIKGFNIKNIKLTDVIKTICIILSISTLLFLIRLKITNITLIGLCSMIIYPVIFKVFYNFNIRMAVLAGTLSSIILVAVEISTSPIVEIIVKNYIIPNQINETHATILITGFLRLVHLLFIFIIVKFRLFFDESELIQSNWNELGKSSKKNIITMLILIISSLFLVTYYIQLDIKYHDASEIFPFLIATLIILAGSVILLNRTINYEKQKIILNMNPDIMVKKIIESSDKEKIKEYIRYINLQINKEQLNKVNHLLEEYRVKNEYFKYTIDDNLNLFNYDYTNYNYVINSIYQEVIKYTKEIEIKLIKELDIYSEIRILNLNKQNFNKLKKFIINEINPYRFNMNYDIIYDSITRIIININISYKEGNTNENIY